ncbi:alpha/beta hydrolase [Gramella sp. BOM4]|nr:alpha/beta hydrolase [Christiangramia bathymodioli]
MNQLNRDSLIKRNNINIIGEGKQPIVFAHGYGCDQNMWRFVYPAFLSDYKVVLFDHVGAGNSDGSYYNSGKYNDLQAFADDILEICHGLELKDVILVGHSVSAMIALLGVVKDPSIFSKVVMIGPSPCYINKNGYKGGFSEEDIHELLYTLDDNFLGWSAKMAPVIMGNPDRPELGEELTNSFCRTNPEIAKEFAHLTFLSDNRSDLPKLKLPTLIIQTKSDAIAPLEVAEFVHKEIPESQLSIIEATGHCPNLSAPEQTVAEIMKFLKS